MVVQHHHMLLPLFLLIKQLVGTRNWLYFTVQHTDQTLFLALYANRPWIFFSPISKGTMFPKLVSLATVETVELQFIIDQSLGLGIFLYHSSFHVACGVWKVVGPPSFLSSLRQNQWTTTLCSDHWKEFFFPALRFIQKCFGFLKRSLSEEQCFLFCIVSCSSYLLSSNYAKAQSHFIKNHMENNSQISSFSSFVNFTCL